MIPDSFIQDLLARVEALKGKLIPADVQVTVTRNYGETAAEKSNELLYHMLIAVVSVSLLTALTLVPLAAMIAIPAATEPVPAAVATKA